MIGRTLAGLLMLWAFGFLLFATTLPRPAGTARTDAIIVPTGAAGRIERGLDLLGSGAAERMLVTGVDRGVRPVEFAAKFQVSDEMMACCVTLGFAAVDTRSNAAETGQWVRQNKVGSLRLVTTDWHMRRAAGELSRTLPTDVAVVEDAVASEPSLRILFVEYHKLMASTLARQVWD